MLVLSRGESQVIEIGDSIEIFVVEIRPGSVRLGITAPAEIPVHRREVADRIRQQERKVKKVLDKLDK